MADLLALHIDPEALKVMHEDALNAFPNECCGFFYGHESETRNITLAVHVDNSKAGDQRRRFEISPVDYMKAEQYALTHGLTLLGVYHSHPNHPAIPSEHDLKQAVPYFSYIIVSVGEGQVNDLTSWQLNEAGTFEEEKIIAYKNS